MAVSAYDENEQRSSSLFNFEEPFDPVFSLEDYVSDNQTIVDKVCICNLGLVRCAAQISSLDYYWQFK